MLLRKIALAALWIALVLSACQPTPELAPEVATDTATPVQPAGSPRPAAVPDAGPSGSATACPPAQGVGTVSPTVSICSITFVVNGREQVVGRGGTLQAVPGDEVQVREAIICVSPFVGTGGEVCVDFAPVDGDGLEVVSEHAGSHMVPAGPGRIAISGPDRTWIVGEEWGYFAAVVNHWPPAGTQDLGCAAGRCERDDRIVFSIRPAPPP